MDNSKKRERNLNFTREETEKLISLIEDKKFIIEEKKMGAVTWRDKQRAWKAIEFLFNNCGFEVFRSAKHLKLKYEALKRDARRKSNRIERIKSSDGETSEATPTIRLTPAEKRVKEMMFLSGTADESQHNSDPIDKPKEKRTFDKLAEAKLEIAVLQKQLFEEELEEIELKKQILTEEIEHKKELYLLEKQEMYLKIDILKAELENKKKES